MTLAPIALFAFNRVGHLERTVCALRKNAGAEESELFIFSDGPRTNADNAKIESVRQFARSISGFKRVTITARDKNSGLSRSIIAGVTEIVNKYGAVIVLEDDLETSPFFLRYMNDALRFYRDEERVISIHGYMYPVKSELPETFFLRGADCWGWATWKRGWDRFEPDGGKLLQELRARHMEKDFDFNGAYPFTSMLRKQSTGRVDSWAIRWLASAFLDNKLTLYPGSSLVSNIGLDASGEHCSPTTQFDITLGSEPIKIRRIPVEENKTVRKALEQYYRTTRPSLPAVALRRLIFQFERWRRRP
ncbi:MAG: glycosyltransferase [Nitrospirota bacterium]|nr:glycosyltransferase [Nitrospirota bacterium]